MDVLITVDTEVRPCTPSWRERSLDEELAQYIDGRTPQGAFGVYHQLSILREHGLKAVFFVDPLFALEVAGDVLRRLVAAIREDGHEVQLHVHTEWLPHFQPPLLGDRRGLHMRHLDVDEQTVLLDRGRDVLAAHGAPGVCAFRAGNYGANFDTLRALARAGFRYDTSWNAAYLGSACALDTGEPLLEPRELEGICEVPIAFFRDYPGHVRHAQLAACSFAELRGALDEAERSGWPTFVIVAHSFELVWRGVRRGRPAAPRRLVIRRFEKLCRYLGENRDRLRTTGFAGLAPRPSASPPLGALASPVGRTAARYVEQLVGRLF